jgi:cold shock CspA family protein
LGDIGNRERAVEGTVKWLSEQKGYGFITGDDGNDYYFNAQSVKGSELPRNGARVAFVPAQGKKGSAAKSVEIQSQPSKGQDDRIPCPHCGKKIVPRIITDRGSLSHSVCPFCGGTVKSFRSWRPLVLILLWAFLFLVVPAFSSR